MPAPLPPSRRGILLGSLAVAVALPALASCDADDLKPHDAAPTTTTPKASPGQPTPDEQLVDGVATDILTALGTALAVHRIAELRTPLGVVIHTHRAHLARLQKTGQKTGKPPHVVAPKDPAAALNAVLTAEGDLQGRLVAAAVRAESGTLAVLLASMSASVGQLLAGPLANPAHP